MEEMQKSIIIEIEEAKMELVEAINGVLKNHQLPMYIVNMILTNLVNQVDMGAKNELETARKQMEMAKSVPQAEDKKGTV